MAAQRGIFAPNFGEFIGCHDETVAQACRALGLAEASSFRLLSA